MKKHFIFAGGFAAGVCCSIISFSLQTANAQNSIEGVIGNPNSNNEMIIEQTTGVVETMPSSQPAPTNMEPLQGSPGVEVAPIPETSTQHNPSPSSETNNEEPSNANIEIDEVLEYE